MSSPKALKLPGFIILSNIAVTNNCRFFVIYSSEVLDGESAIVLNNGPLDNSGYTL